MFFAWSLGLVVVAWAAYTLNPIYASLVSNNYPNENVPFPGIALCSNNKLSKTAVRNYARVL